MCRTKTLHDRSIFCNENNPFYSKLAKPPVNQYNHINLNVCFGWHHCLLSFVYQLHWLLLYYKNSLVISVNFGVLYSVTVSAGFFSISQSLNISSAGLRKTEMEAGMKWLKFFFFTFPSFLFSLACFNTQSHIFTSLCVLSLPIVWYQRNFVRLSTTPYQQKKMLKLHPVLNLPWRLQTCLNGMGNTITCLTRSEDVRMRDVEAGLQWQTSRFFAFVFYDSFSGSWRGICLYIVHMLILDNAIQYSGQSLVHIN